MTLRAFFRLLAMAGWFAICASAHLLVRRFTFSPWPRRLLRGTGWIVGARVRCQGAAPPPGTLIVANHVSWLDIPVLAGATGCAFVAKEGLRTHPFMRWLCEQNGTVFVDRDRRATVSNQLSEMEKALREPRPLTLFPEGTVGPEGRMLPFRSSLLKLAEEPPHPPVWPVALDYGRHAAEFGWPQGEPGLTNFLRLLGRRGTVPITIHLLQPLPGGLDRKRLARDSHAAIGGALTPSGEDQPRV